MSRHKNIPVRGKGNLYDSDEDDFLSSSIEDSYSVSPDTASRYMYDPNRTNDHRNMQSFISTNTNQSVTGTNSSSNASSHYPTQSAFISPDDFPDDEGNLTTNASTTEEQWMPWHGQQQNGSVSGPKVTLAPSLTNQGNKNANSSIFIQKQQQQISLSSSPSNLPTPAIKKPTAVDLIKKDVVDSNISSNKQLTRAATVPAHLATCARDSLAPTPPPSTAAAGATVITSSTPFIAKSQQATALKTATIDRKPLLDAYESLIQSNKEKPSLSIVVIGHVDAGKSTLMGHLLFKLGQVDARSMNKYQREAQKQGKASFAYAWVLDQTEEERSRGVTMDVAQTAFETDKKRIIVLDAPGHRDFIPRMIIGTAQADAALLVINATRGEFETGFCGGLDNASGGGGGGAASSSSASSSSTILTSSSEGQTREHAILARALGINQFIVAINKMDTVDWSEERFKTISSQLDTFLRRLGTSLHVIFCPVSGLEGTNVFERVTDTKHPLFQWYKGGPCLLEYINLLECPGRQVDKPLRFTISDVFKPSIGQGICVSGRIESGGLATSNISTDLSRLLCLPSTTEVTVKAIGRTAVLSQDVNRLTLDDNVITAGGGPSTISAGEQSLNYAFAGDYVCLHLTCPQPEHVEPGSVLCEFTSPVPCSDRFRANLLIVQVPRALCKGFTALFHSQSVTATATLKKLHHFQGRDGKRKVEMNNPRIVSLPGQLEVTIQLDRVICLETNDECRALGRFTLRSNSRTIAGGSVTKVLKRHQV